MHGGESRPGKWVHRSVKKESAHLRHRWRNQEIHEGENSPGDYEIRAGGYWSFAQRPLRKNCLAAPE